MLDYSGMSRSIAEVLNKELFFICGAMKSGTTWLQLLLDGHPHIACRGEGHFEHILAPNLQKALNDYNQKIDHKNKTIFREIPGYPLLSRDHYLFLLVSTIGLQLAAYGNDPGIRAIGEKTPGNIRALPLLSYLFPNSRFIHIIRDGRDVAVSGWFHNLRLTPDWTKETFGSLTNYIDRLAPIWVKAMQAGLQFGQSNPNRYLQLRYEDLYSDTPNEVTRILNFLDVDAAPGYVTGCCEAGAFRRLSGGRESGEEDAESHFRKGSIGDWRNHFDDAAIKAFEKHAGSVLREMGYV